MFRKTFICVVGLIAGVSAGAYSSGFFNQENIVTTTYNDALDRMGLAGHDSRSSSGDMIKGGMAAKGDMSVNSETGSFVSAGLTPSRPGIDSITESFGSSEAASEEPTLAQELLAANGLSDSSKIKRLDMKDILESAKASATDLAVDEESKIEKEAVANLAKEAEAAIAAATLKKAELKRRQAELERKIAEKKKMKAERDRVRAEEARVMAEKARIKAEEARLQAELKQAQALVEKRFSKEVYKSSTGEKLNYRKLVPAKSPKDKLHPLVIFLHGKGERGGDNQLQLKHGLKLFAADEGMKAFPAIVIAPQCPADQTWSTTLDQKNTTPKIDPQPTASMRLVIELLDSMLLTESVDPDRVYVTGLSMGGFGTFDLIARRPTLFAAAVPLCGGGDPSPAKIRRLLRLPMWVVHGTEDKVVDINRSREMVDALETAGASPRYSELAGFGHNIWDATYGDIELYNWMFSQSKNGTIKRRVNQSQVRKSTAVRRKSPVRRAKPTVTPKRRVTSKPITKATPTPQGKRSSIIDSQEDALQGQWKVLAASQKGQQASKKALDKMSVTFDSDKFVIQIDDRLEVAKFKLGDSKKTPQIDIISGREGVEESAGIYELSGDKLIICWGEPGRPRPTRFVNFMNVKSLVLEKQ